MKRLLGALLLAAFASSAFAMNDVATEGVPPTGAEAMLDELFVIPLDVNNYCVGVGFDGTYVWVSAGDQATGACEFYIFDQNGVQVDNVAQGGGASGWGHRDMVWDGTYMYGSYSTMIDAFSDPATLAGGFFGPINPCRALAYNGTYFYTGGFSENLYQLEWDGNWNSTATATSLSGPYSGTYGLAYDCALDKLWMSTAASTGELHRFAMDGWLEQTFVTTAHGTHGGCECGDTIYGYCLILLVQESPDAVIFMDVESGGASATHEASWGQIKSLF
jgi:hypothetical protein